MQVHARPAARAAADVGSVHGETGMSQFSTHPFRQRLALRDGLR
jgi:hypothetical protein